MAKEWAKPFYRSKAWKLCRDSYIKSVHGLCESCLAKGRVKPGKILHHTVELDISNINYPEISLNHSLLQFCCQECHNRIHHGNDSEVVADGLMFDDEGQLVKR